MLSVGQIMGTSLESKLAKWQKEHPSPCWEKGYFINHGMGLMTKTEHTELIHIGAIQCVGEIDTVLANYPLLVTRTSGGEKNLTDLGGNLFQIQCEMESQQKKGIKCYIEFYPRAWTQYYENKEAQNKARYAENQALESLINEEIPF